MTEFEKLVEEVRSIDDRAADWMVENTSPMLCSMREGKKYFGGCVLSFFCWGETKYGYYYWRLIDKILQMNREAFGCAEDPLKDYITEPIDYTGCHPVIAEALKALRAIECYVWDANVADRRTRTVYAYDSTCGLPYRTSNFGPYRNAEPIPKKKTETRVKSAPEIMQWLVDNKYRVDSSGFWCGRSFNFVPEMWQFCGKPPSDEFSWHKEWLEEVEI